MTTSASETGLGADEARQQLYELMREDIEFREKTTRVLELGKRYLDVENAHLTRIDSTADYWEAIASTDPPSGTFPPGLSLDLGNTYCRRTIQKESPIALHDAPSQGWEDDPAFETHGLHCYLGVPVTVADDIYGTVCFVAEEPRSGSFMDEGVMFAELIGRLLGHAIEKEHDNTILTERKQLIDILCRVLRHNLRTDLGVIRGHAEIVQAQPSADTQASTETIIKTIDELLELSEKTRQLSGLVTKPFTPQELDVGSIVQRITTEVEDAYPDASVSVNGATDTQIFASPKLETALRELLMNAAKHAGDAPSVTVDLENTSSALKIHVSDDGPGLPENERPVLKSGDEAPLKHGSGLGLWLVYWIVARHEGNIDVAVSDTGTTVAVTLPHGMLKIPTN